MKFIRIAVVVCMVFMLSIGPAGADEISELKAMIQQLKNGHWYRIRLISYSSFSQKLAS